MSDHQSLDGNCFKDAICINSSRIYDSCSSKDCLRDLEVFFPDTASNINDASSIKVKSVDILDVTLDVDNVPFNKGCYTVDITFYFKVKVSVSGPSLIYPVDLYGLAVYEKRVILYGNEGNVKVFSSTCNHHGGCHHHGKSLPIATIQVTPPVILSHEIIPSQEPSPTISLPSFIEDAFDGAFFSSHHEQTLYITLGVFSIVQLERNVQITVPIYDFCIPKKECIGEIDHNPCKLFKQIKFPTDAFFPPNICNDYKCPTIEHISCEDDDDCESIDISDNDYME
jgi:hypothetical protein